MTFFLLLVCAGLGFALYRTRRRLQMERGRAGVRGLSDRAAESRSKVAEDISDLRYRQEIAALQEQLQQAQTDREIAHRETTALQQQIRDLDGRVRQADSRIQEVADEKGSLLSENRQLRARLQELSQQESGVVQTGQAVEGNARLQAQLEDYRTQNEQYRQNISQLEAQQEQLRSELREAQVNQSNTRHGYEEQLDHLELQLANANQQIDDLKLYIEETTERAADQERNYLERIAALNQKISQTEAQIHATDQSRLLEQQAGILIEKDRRIQELETFIGQLEIQLSELKENQSAESAQLEQSLALLRDHLALITDGSQTGVKAGSHKENNHAALRELASHLLDAHAQQEYSLEKRIKELESDKQSLETKVSNLWSQVEGLKQAIQGFNAQPAHRIPSNNCVKLLSTLPEIYSGEKEAIIVTVLKNARSLMPDQDGKDINYWRRRKDVIDELISLNSDNALVKMHGEVEGVFSGYRNFNGRVRDELRKLGFEAIQDGHIHVYPLNADNYRFSFGGTVSDCRACENIARDFKHYFF